jgi:WD40 repeat protein
MLIAALALSSLPSPAAAPPKKLSYWQDIRPIFLHSCTSCHQPEKLKGKLDLTTYHGLKIGGKTGAAFLPGDPAKSLIISQVTGDEPEMPEKGDPLRPEEVSLISRWIQQGGIDDTPAGASTATTIPSVPTQLPVYHLAPAISAIAWSPDGNLLAVAGYHEILLHHADGSGLVARLASASPHITSSAFSKVGSRVLAAGGAPGLFGLVELWNVPSRQRLAAYPISRDTLFAASFSPTEDRIAVGCADKSARVLDAATGKELFSFDAQSDWVLGAAFTLDGLHLVTGSRDKTLKFTALPATQPAQTVNEPQEPITCLARHPTQDLVAAGGAQGTPRLYHIANPQKPTDSKRDPNQLRALERQPGPVNALAFSPNGSLLAIASTGEVRLYKTKDYNRAATLADHDGPIFCVAFNPDASRLCTGGYDGQLRIFDLKTQKPIASFIPVPLAAP